MKRAAVHLRRVWAIASWTGTAVLFITLAALLVARSAEVVPLVEQTGSMRPALAPGDLLFVKKVPAADVQPGDVVTFDRPNHPGSTLTHRVITVEPRPGALQFTTKGDANPAPEHWAIPERGTVGTLAARIPDAGRLARPVDDPRTRALLILLACLLGCLVVVRRIWAKPAPAPARRPRLFAPAREYR
jgi:signal peptidase I